MTYVFAMLGFIVLAMSAEIANKWSRDQGDDWSSNTIKGVVLLLVLITIIFFIGQGIEHLIGCVK